MSFITEQTNESDQSTITLLQQRAARVTGALYLVTMATSMISELAIKSKFMVAGDPAQTAERMRDSFHLVRLALCLDLTTYLCVVGLVWGLYVVLKPVHAAGSVLGLAFRTIENAVAATGVLFGFAGLAIIKKGGLVDAVPSEALISAGYSLFRVSGEGQAISFAFVGAGSVVFSWLWLKSRYVPKGFAVLGLIASPILGLVSLAALAYPVIWSTIGLSYMAPMSFYEVGLGLWLLVKGLRGFRP